MSAPSAIPGKRPRVAVVIPAYNEAESITGVLEDLWRFQSERQDLDLVPIVVNDGSSDRTADIVRELERSRRVLLLDLSLNLGIGKAVQTGFQQARRIGAEIALQFDGDGQHIADQIAEICRPILEGQADVVVGSRYMRGGGGNVSSAARQLGTGLFSILIRALTGRRIKDVTSGFRAFSTKAIDFVSRYYPDDYPEVQAYVSLHRRGFRIQEVPVRMRAREAGSSSISAFKKVYYVIKVSLATLLETWRRIPT